MQIENIYKFKPEIRNDRGNKSINDILFLKELDSKIEVLSSKESIAYKNANKDGNSISEKFYDFLIKCDDANDITKEIKTFEINNIFKIKHFDVNDFMSLKRYFIVSIAPTIILGEWLSNCVSPSKIIS